MESPVSLKLTNTNYEQHLNQKKLMVLTKQTYCIREMSMSLICLHIKSIFVLEVKIIFSFKNIPL